MQYNTVLSAFYIIIDQPVDDLYELYLWVVHDVLQRNRSSL